MAGSIIDAEKVREDETEVEYRFQRIGAKEPSTLLINKVTGRITMSGDASRHEALLVMNRLWKAQDRAGDPNLWVDRERHVG